MEGCNTAIWLASLACLGAAYTHAYARSTEWRKIHANIRCLSVALSLSGNSVQALTSLRSISALLLFHRHTSQRSKRNRVRPSAVHTELDDWIPNALASGRHAGNIDAVKSLKSSQCEIIDKRGMSFTGMLSKSSAHSLYSATSHAAAEDKLWRWASAACLTASANMQAHLEVKHRVCIDNGRLVEGQAIWFVYSLRRELASLISQDCRSSACRPNSHQTRKSIPSPIAIRFP